MAASTRPERSDVLGTLRRNPSFTRLYIAQLVSFAGNWLTLVALLGLVLDLSESTTLTGLVFTLDLLPFALASPIAGVVVDRFDRRMIMISADLMRVGAALGFLLVTSEDTLWIAFVCLALLGIGAAFFEPASSAAIPNLVREEDLPTANVLVGSAWGTMLAVGAALGGVIVALLGREASFIGDAMTFGVSAILLATIRADFHAEGARKQGRMTIIADVTEMLRFAKKERKVFSLLLVKGGFGLSAGVLAMIPVLAKDVFGRGDAGIGLIMSARGLGALIGPFLLQRLFGTSDRALFRAISWTFAIFAAGYIFAGLSPGLELAALGALVAHIGGGGQWTMSSIGLQRFTPDAIRGRVFSADYMLVTLTIGIATIVAGALAETFSARTVTIAFASIGGLWSIGWPLITRRYWPQRVTARENG